MTTAPTRPEADRARPRRIDGREAAERLVLLAAVVSAILTLGIAAVHVEGWLALPPAASAVALVLGAGAASRQATRRSRIRQGLTADDAARPGPLAWAVAWTAIQYALAGAFLLESRQPHTGGSVALILGVALLTAAGCSTVRLARWPRRRRRPAEGPPLGIG